MAPQQWCSGPKGVWGVEDSTGALWVVRGRGSHAGEGVLMRSDWRRGEDKQTAAELPNLYSGIFF